MTALAPLLEIFLTKYLPQDRGCRANTSAAYALTFQLLLSFVSRRVAQPPCRLHLEHIDEPMVLAFLDHLEAERKNKIATRNYRLAAIRSFFRFVESREVAALGQVSRILAIPKKQTDHPVVPFLTEPEAKALLAAPSGDTWLGVRDRTMILLAIACGLRVSELVGLRMQDVQDGSEMTLRVTGKGGRQRELPLAEPCRKALRAWKEIRGPVSSPALFLNARRNPMTRWGFRHLLSKHVAAAAIHADSLCNKRTSPHVLRHTCAMMVLNVTHDIRKVALWLGHAHLQTTEVYTRAAVSTQMALAEEMVPKSLQPGRFQPEDTLLQQLRILSRPSTPRYVKSEANAPSKNAACGP